MNKIFKNKRKLLKKEYDNNSARTLCPSYIGKNKSGWTITGEVQEDYYQWVNEFTAKHKTYGIVQGDFEGIVEFTSEKGLKHFLKHHPYQEWDYQDI